MRKKEFATAALDPKHKALIIHVNALSVNLSDEIHLSRRAQIGHLKADEVPSKVPSKYTDFANVFSRKLVGELPEHTEINNHVIELVDD